MMEPIIGTVIVAVITGIFSVITLKIQRNQDKLIKKIDEQTVFIEKEKEVRQRLVRMEKKRDAIMEQMTILSMHINLHLIDGLTNTDPKIVKDLHITSQDLEKSYKEITEKIKDISKEYEILIDVTSTIQREMDDIQKNLDSKKRN